MRPRPGACAAVRGAPADERQRIHPTIHDNAAAELRRCSGDVGRSQVLHPERGGNVGVRVEDTVRRHVEPCCPNPVRGLDAVAVVDDVVERRHEGAQVHQGVRSKMFDP